MTSIRSILWLGAGVLALGGTLRPGAALALTPSYLATIGTDDVTGADDAHFYNPASVAVDTANGHILVVDQANQRVQVFDSVTYAYVATLGTTAAPGTDNAHFLLPQGVGFDATHGRILVADTGNGRVQIFNAATLGYVGTITLTATATDTNPAVPTDVAFDPAHNEILVVDQANDDVRVYSGTTFASVGEFGQAGLSLPLAAPSGIDVDTANNHILVADTANNMVQIFNSDTFTYVGEIGDSGGNAGSGNTEFNQPNGVSFDSANQNILVADFNNDRVQIYDASTYTYLGTIGQTLDPGTDDTTLNGPASVAVNPANSQIFVVDSDNQRVQVYSQSSLPESLVASVLPGSRSVQIGTTATVFGTMENYGKSSLANCQIGLPGSAPTGLTLSYQTASASNALTGSPDTPVTIPANGLQSFVLSFQSSAAFDVTGMPLDFTCDGSAPAPSTPGVNTLDLVYSATPIPDIIALAVTESGDGIVRVPYSTGGTGAFAVASVDVGAAGTLTVETDTGSATLPLTATVCASNPSNGSCLAPPAASFQESYQTNATPTYSIFVNATAPIAFAPGTARIFLRFVDSNGVSHGSTSVAVETD